MNEAYQEKLRNPLWQKRRLEVLELCNWRCQICGSRDRTLNVHHKVYIKNHEPWDYEDYLLTTLCEDCHKKQHLHQQYAKETLLSMFAFLGIGSNDMIGMAESLGCIHETLGISGQTLMEIINFALQDKQTVEVIWDRFLESK